MISSTIPQLFSHYPPPHSCTAVTNAAGSSPAEQSQDRGASPVAPHAAPCGATAPAATRSPRCFQAGGALAAAWRHPLRERSGVSPCRHTAALPEGALQPAVPQLKTCLRGFDCSM